MMILPCAVKVKTLFTMKYNLLEFLLNFFTSYFALIELFFLTVWHIFYNFWFVHCFSKLCSKRPFYVTLNYILVYYSRQVTAHWILQYAWPVPKDLSKHRCQLSTQLEDLLGVLKKLQQIIFLQYYFLAKMAFTIADQRATLEIQNPIEILIEVYRTLHFCQNFGILSRDPAPVNSKHDHYTTK